MLQPLLGGLASLYKTRAARARRGGEPGYLGLVNRRDFTRDCVITKTCSMDVIRGDDTFKGRLDHLFGRRGDNVKTKLIPVQISKSIGIRCTRD